MTQSHQDPLNLRHMFEPVVSSLGYELVGVECAGIASGGILRVYVDSADGITADDCQKVSYQLSGLLDVEEPISSSYTLEVSSPGLDRPLFERKDFDRFVGEQVRMQLNVPVDGQRKFVGVLRGMRADDVVLEVDGNELCIPFARIIRARLAPHY